MALRNCWCGNKDYTPFGPEYGECRVCGTLVFLKDLLSEDLQVQDDETDFYGKKYWLEHQPEAFGYDDIHTRARTDLTERNLHWLRTLLKFCLPPARVLELGCAHGSFVALLRQAGYDATGVEMSPWVVEFGQKTFDVPIAVGPLETLDNPPDSMDAIVLMDVLEHLPDPVATMSHCLHLLKPSGLLLIQTPQYKEDMNYASLLETHGSFLEQLKAGEHLHLFSKRSITLFFQRLGAKHIQYENAIFSHYDMFFAASRKPLSENTLDTIEAALKGSAHGRLALAFLDIYARESEAIAKFQADRAQLVEQLGRMDQLEAQNVQLVEQLDACEADRSARLEVIENQGQQLGRIPQLEEEKKQLVVQLEACEADRAARLEVIEDQGRQLGRIPQLEEEKNQLVAQLEACEADRANLHESWLVRIGIKFGVISTDRK